MTRNRHPAFAPAEPTDGRGVPSGARRSARSRRTRRILLAAVVLGAAACAAGEPYMRDPRRLVIRSGERLAPTRERMREIDVWWHEQGDSIWDDPSFMINWSLQEGPVYPWETLEVNERGDTAFIRFQREEVHSPYLIYAHLHLMAAQDRLDRWLPEAEGGTPFEIERAILSRVADGWLYERSIYDKRAYDLLEELIYSKENGHLGAYILTARPDAFVEARRAWLEEDPSARDAYIAWFRKTFERDPPGLRGGS